MLSASTGEFFNSGSLLLELMDKEVLRKEKKRVAI